MKLRLEIEMKIKDYKEAKGVGANASGDVDSMTPEQIRKEIEDYLYDTMFEICEEWVIHGNQPDMELIK